ncbi:hypothetical protein DPMN_088653 [Dreissena polymorpha]|uniref:Uncharacterized protein n=1 Tax=Dreissena polymorpha TaxID=45954 RepID=A0A9D4KUG9_DREPO|nr:hypothetical protein DPMN_088653 [Dreissena polymorpha]
MVDNAPESIDCLVKPCHGTSCAVLVDSRTSHVLHPTSDLQQVANKGRQPGSKTERFNACK